MSCLPPAFEWPLQPGRRGLLVLLGGGGLLPGCASGSADTPADAAGAGAITAITLESDCNGCRTGRRLELQRDGGAVFTLTGKSRLGTRDQVSRARISTGDFAALARAATAAGFFAMAERYEEDGLQDGRWSLLSVQRGPTVKQVFRREEAGPPALRALEAAVLQWQARTAFAPG